MLVAKKPCKVFLKDNFLTRTLSNNFRFLSWYEAFINQMLISYLTSKDKGLGKSPKWQAPLKYRHSSIIEIYGGITSCFVKGNIKNQCSSCSWEYSCHQCNLHALIFSAYTGKVAYWIWLLNSVTGMPFFLKKMLKVFWYGPHIGFRKGLFCLLFSWLFSFSFVKGRKSCDFFPKQRCYCFNRLSCGGENPPCLWQ